MQFPGKITIKQATSIQYYNIFLADYHCIHTHFLVHIALYLTEVMLATNSWPYDQMYYLSVDPPGKIFKLILVPSIVKLWVLYIMQGNAHNIFSDKLLCGDLLI